MKRIGIDFGAIYFKGVIIDENNSIIYSYYNKYNSTPLNESLKFIEKIEELYPDEEFFIGITSLTSGKIKEAKSIHVNEIVSTASGVKFYHPEVMSIIELGGETAKFITLKENNWIHDFSVNTHCAAGTGSFIEQQAKRLNMSVEELSETSIKASKGARIAGRCSVFAKSDMIHLQQKGTPVEEIAYGLCLAIARNAISTLLSGREILTPLVIAGGCAKNKGIIRAFSDLLKLGSDKIIVSSTPGLEAVIGAAIEAKRRDVGRYSTKEIKAILKNITQAEIGRSKINLQKLNPCIQRQNQEPSEIFYDKKSGYLGIDVGSVSTNIVIIDSDGRVLSAVYLPTAGNPIKALREGLSIIRDRFKGEITVLGAGTTGSGRYLAAKLIGADLIKNEITCQMLGTTFYIPDADTIFEIGGQDSKFISLENGAIADFVMNKICAAGTGSFIEEQAGQLGIDIYRDFAEKAFNSMIPPHFSSNCTVFMESELASALKNGIHKEDACAGISYAIARNYLEKVVGKKKIGNRIVFQGGVASNMAVVSAFRNILEKEIIVHPYNRISGAIGAAIAVMKANIKKSQFKGFEIKIESKPKTFECRACSNYCEVTEINIHNERAFFGDVCEKFTSKGATKDAGLPNLAEEFLNRCESIFRDSNNSSTTVGIPRASFFLAYLPFWWKFFSELGMRPVLSSPTSEKTLIAGSKYLSVSTCLPVKIAIGHIAELMEKNLDFVFFPSVVSLPSNSKQERSAVCPYTISIPFMFNKFNKNILAPQLSMTDDDSGFVKSFAQLINIHPQKIARALREAKKYQEHIEKEIKGRGEKLLDSSDTTIKFIVLGRPYNVFDTYMNMNLFAHLKKMNVLTLPYNYIESTEEDSLSSIPWKFSTEIIRTIKYVLHRDNLYPVILSNFGCGPDGITQKMIEELLRERPHLMLEFDEHRGEAGLITRLEAFLDLVEATKISKKQSVSYEIKLTYPEARDMKKTKIFVPYFADHARALTGAFKFAGFNAELLPVPDEDTKVLGTSFSSGKECHAYSMLLGDLMKLPKRYNDTKIYYCFTGTNIPCLLSQFQNSMNFTLDKNTRERIVVIAPVTEDFLKILKMDGCVKLYEGLLAIEFLMRLRCRIKPYEIDRGTTLKIYNESLEDIEDAVARGDVLKGFKKSLTKFSKIRIKSERTKPIIGIAGDIYTRINDFANEDLFNYLEDNSFEVMPAPFEIDIIDFGIEREFYHSLSKKRILNLFSSGVLYLRKSQKRREFLSIFESFNFPLRTDEIIEPDYREVKVLARNYFQNEYGELILLNIAKIQDFIRKGARGIINAMCFNCMVGTSSHAIIERIKRDNNNIPIISLVYSATETQSQRMLLDAFLERVKTQSNTI